MNAARLVTLNIALALIALASPAIAAPDEELLGKSAGYPVGTTRTWFFDERVRVGSFSHADQIFQHNVLKKSGAPLPLAAAAQATPFEYVFQDRKLKVDDFLAHQRITGLLIIKDGSVLFERYQYDRKPDHRMLSHSMAKSIVSIAIGFALAEGRIASLDDTAAKYVPELAGSAYGETKIRNLLRMSSGVKYIEDYSGNDDSAKFVALRNSQGTLAALRAFGEREVAQGARFHYASSETVTLATVLRAVTGMTLSEYVTARLWQPMGAEADATWVKGSDGLEVGAGAFNATLRDYGRLGMLLANDGAVGTRQVVPKEYVLEATDWRRHPEAFAPRRATPFLGYGYQFWIFPAEKRKFALLGVYGQSIFVDPELKLVMVITAAAKNASVGKESFAMERTALWRGVVGMFGKW